jgi:hypothetical protein
VSATGDLVRTWYNAFSTMSVLSVRILYLHDGADFDDDNDSAAVDDNCCRIPLSDAVSLSASISIAFLFSSLSLTGSLFLRVLLPPL